VRTILLIDVRAYLWRYNRIHRRFAHGHLAGPEGSKKSRDSMTIPTALWQIVLQKDKCSGAKAGDAPLEPAAAKRRSLYEATLPQSRQLGAATNPTVGGR
jgi:hypothetical protein